MADTLVRNKDVIWREIDGKIVIINTDAMATYILNKTAARIWDLCDGTNATEKIAEDICNRFDVLPDQADADVKETIQKFIDMGLLKRK